jgi:hypothetical protein
VTEPATEPLPRVAAEPRFVPFARAVGAPHVIVDGPAAEGTVLALSHWPDSGTPAALAADTSAAIVDRYLRADPHGPEVDVVTNNHFDEDGLFGLWLLVARPAEGAPERALALEAAEAGDFGTWRDPWAARCALAVMAMAERGTTPFPAVRRALAPTATVDPAGAIYEALLPRTGRLLADPDRHRLLWEPAWQRVAADIALLDAGEARMEDAPQADVAVLRAPRALHGMAVHPRTPRTRVLTVTPDGTLVLRHRYETWVRYASRPLAPRVDLTPLLPRLQELETRPGTWRFEGVRAITPRLWLADAGGRPAPSGLGPERLVEELATFLAGARAA